MKTVAPAYYGRFACIKGACRHSCCIGWEIDIDPDTLRIYQQAQGKMGERLKSGIDSDNGCFRLDAEERCPFLNGEGLCDIILQMGEESLCQICADHPRFRNFFSDRTEIGLGLCCEAAARLILTDDEPLRLIPLTDDGGAEEPDDEEAELLAIRERLLAADVLDVADLPGWAAFLMTLERLDDAWADRLTEVQQLPPHRHAEAEQWRKPFRRLYEYLLYRHMPGALEDGDVQGRAAFAALMWRLIRAMFNRLEAPNMDDLVELARLYSSEIEYSDENIGAILDRLDDMI